MDTKTRALLAGANRLVVKVGTSTLTYADGKLNLLQMESLSRELANLKLQGREVILVTSGAIGVGIGKMGLTERPKAIPEKQALAAIGQGILMQMYEKYFDKFDCIVAQVLLTRDDIAHRERYLNARNTLLALLRFGTIPIINENDTVAFEEIKFGDNDTLAALVAGLVDADLLVLLSDIDGLYTADPRKDPSAQLIPLVEEITAEVENLAGGTGSSLASGGMMTKINAAKMTCSRGIPMVLANGSNNKVLREIAAGVNPGTVFAPREQPLNSRKGWIAYASKTKGKIYLDGGAEKALVENGGSLLASGVVRVEGIFQRGCAVSIYGASGEIARGIANYGSTDIEKIKGSQSKDIISILGYKDDDEIIHRDNLTLRP